MLFHIQIQRETAYESGRIERSYQDWKDVEHDMNEVEKKKLEWGQGWVKLKISQAESADTLFVRHLLEDLYMCCSLLLCLFLDFTIQDSNMLGTDDREGNNTSKERERENT